MLRNKTAIECWNIIKYEIEGIIDKFVSLKKNKENGLAKKLFVKRSYYTNSVQASYVESL